MEIPTGEKQTADVTTEGTGARMDINIQEK
jgi:hypothetical protein